MIGGCVAVVLVAEVGEDVYRARGVVDGGVECDEDVDDEDKDQDESSGSVDPRGSRHGRIEGLEQWRSGQDVQ